MMERRTAQAANIVVKHFIVVVVGGLWVDVDGDREREARANV